MTDEQTPRIPANPREWRPQTMPRGRYQPEIIDPIVEPFWSGIRVIAHFRDSGTEEWGTVEVLDSFGDDATEVAPLAVDHLRRSILASEAVIDGILTNQATAGGEGTSVVVFARSSPVKRLVIGGAESDIRYDTPKPRPRDSVPAFVALDLLSIDGQTLFDVPLLERKRLLESVVAESLLVRRTAFVRPPVDTWLASWRSMGFRELAYKAANGRYVPGERNDTWAIASIPPA